MRRRSRGTGRSSEIEQFLRGPFREASGGGEGARASFLAWARQRRAAHDEAALGGAQGGGAASVRGRVTLPAHAALFPYQRDAVDQLQRWFGTKEEGRGPANASASRRSAMLSLPTGGGKTRTAMWFVRTCILWRKRFRVLWLAPARELIEQAKECVEGLWARFPAPLDVVVAVNELQDLSTRERHPRTLFLATTQKAARRLRSLSARDYDLLVFDEAHQAVATSFRRVVQALQERGVPTLGLTATPGRTLEEEGGALPGLFGAEIIVPEELRDDPVRVLVSLGVLSKIQIHAIALRPPWENFRVRSATASSFNKIELAAHPARFWATVETIVERAQDGGRLLVFGASLVHCHALRAAVRSRGVAAEVLSHEVALPRRQDVLGRFRRGGLPVLINQRLLATGYDCPGITDVVLATPIRSAILWEQIVGRVSRGPKIGGAPIGHVWELDDHRAMHERLLSFARYLGDLWD